MVPSAPAVNRPIVDVVIDNQDADATFHRGSFDWYGWNAWIYWQAYLGNARYHNSQGRTGSWAQLRAVGLPQGDYEVYVSYPKLWHVWGPRFHIRSTMTLPCWRQ